MSCLVRHRIRFPVTSCRLSRVEGSRSFQRHPPLFLFRRTPPRFILLLTILFPLARVSLVLSADTLLFLSPSFSFRHENLPFPSFLLSPVPFSLRFKSGLFPPLPSPFSFFIQSFSISNTFIFLPPLTSLILFLLSNIFLSLACSERVGQTV